MASSIALLKSPGGGNVAGAAGQAWIDATPTTPNTSSSETFNTVSPLLTTVAWRMPTRLMSAMPRATVEMIAMRAPDPCSAGESRVRYTTSRLQIVAKVSTRETQ